MLTPDEIRNKRFEKGFSGYKPEEVDEFLDKLCAEVEQLHRERDSLENKLEVVAGKLEEYRADEEAMRAAILNAQKLGDSILKEAREKAQQITDQAQAQANAAIDGIGARIAKEQLLLDALKTEVSDFKESLMNTYRKHLELISELPEHRIKAAAPKPASMPPAPKPAPEPEPAPVHAPASAAQPQVSIQVQLHEEPAEEIHPEPPVVSVPHKEEAPVQEHQKPRVIQLARTPEPDEAKLGHTMEIDVPEDSEDDIMSMDIVSPAGVPEIEKPKSKFGPLKFGADFDFDDEPTLPAKSSFFSRRKR